MRVLWLILSFACGCSPEGKPTGEYEGDDPGECGDGADNDQDGFFDCYDDGCVGSPDCEAFDTGSTDTGSDTGNDSGEDTGEDTGGDLDENACEGISPTVWSAQSMSAIVTGTSDDDNEMSDLLGWDVVVCDLNQDGNDDVVISAPNGAVLQGQVGIFWGPGDNWDTGLDMSDADVYIQGVDPMAHFVGTQLECGDVNGDGADDLVVGQSAYSMFVQGIEIEWSDAGIYIFDGMSLPTLGDSLTEADAMVTLTHDVGENYFHVYSPEFWLVDIEGDGRSEIFYFMKRDLDATGAPQASLADGKLWVLGDLNWGVSNAPWDAPMTDYLLGKLIPDSDDAIKFVDAWNVAGQRALAIGQGAHKIGANFPGEFNLVMSPSLTNWGDGALIGDLESLALTGTEDMSVGWAVVRADLDIDGVSETIISAPGASSSLGQVHRISDSLAELDLNSAPLADISNDYWTGSETDAFWGWNLLNVGDVDGDGGDDLLVSDISLMGSVYGSVSIYSGACLAVGGTIDDALLYQWVGEEERSFFGAKVSTGDIDGDGLLDVVMGSHDYKAGAEYPPGRVYIYLSSQNQGR